MLASRACASQNRVWEKFALYTQFASKNLRQVLEGTRKNALAYDQVASGGRYLSIDPVTTDANTGSSFNRYAYANNSPYRYIDPDGRDARDDQLANDLKKSNDRACGGGAYCSTGGTADVRGDASTGLSTAISMLPFVGGAYGMLDEYAEGNYGAAAFNGATVIADFASFGLAGTVMRGAKIGGALAKGARVAATPFFRTAKAATKAAEALGFRKINETVHGGQAVYRRGQRYITRDMDGTMVGLGKWQTRLKTLVPNPHEPEHSMQI